jgi:asparagine synthase (glutamine-hydrolysing)
MPGLVGLITEMPADWAKPQLARMISTLQHEPFYTRGSWNDERLGVYVGWAERENSFADGMPFSNERGDIVLLFSGEEYPEQGTKAHLRAKGHELDAKGASYLVHISEEDPTFPAGLNGRFHGLLVDRRVGISTLFNDRYGMQRLYYYQTEQAFYFAAEAKAILSVRPELRVLDTRGLGEFVACGCVMENRTLFKGLHVLPPASAWVFRNASIESKRTYFEASEWEQQEPLTLEGYYRELREVFARNLPRYFNGNERIGMSITGGLDTRMILAWHKPDAKSLPCYTFGGMFRDCHDVVVARRVAEVCKQDHEVITIGHDFLSRFARYAERAVYLSDGCVEVNRAPALYASEKARTIAPVRMTGNYGSEVLRPQTAFKPGKPVEGLFDSEVLSQVDAASKTYTRLLETHPVSFSAFRQAPWHHYGLLALEQSQVSMRSPFLDNDIVRIALRAPDLALATSDVCLRLIADGNEALYRIRTDRGLGGKHNGAISTIARTYLEFTFKAEYAYDYGMPQWVATIDHLFSTLHLERMFLGRHKFWHFRVWYRDSLSSYIQEMLLDSRSLSRPYLRGNALKRIVEAHVKGTRNYTSAIHKALSLELVNRLFIDSQ